MRRAATTLIVLVLGLFLLTTPTFASVRCETQYGGKEVCVTTGALQVNKEVFDPQSKKYVDNLGINDYKFSPSELLSFRISVKNVGDATLNKVTVSDTPQAGFLELATGSLNFEITDLKPGESKSQEIKLRVADESKMPQNNTICIVNAAEASASDSRDRDTAQLCLERKVLAVSVKELPKAGPEGWFLSLFGSVSGLAIGSRLLRFGHANSSQSYYQATEDRFLKKGRR